MNCPVCGEDTAGKPLTHVREQHPEHAARLALGLPVQVRQTDPDVGRAPVYPIYRCCGPCDCCDDDDDAQPELFADGEPLDFGVS